MIVHLFHLRQQWFRDCILALVAVCFLCIPAACQTPAARSAVLQYLQAAQKNDYEVLIRLSFAYQTQVQQTTAESPKILLPKRLSGLHDTTLSEVSGELPAIVPDYAIGFEDQARLAVQLLPKGATWKIAEWQAIRMRANAFSPYFTVYAAYVRIRYPFREAAPTIKRSIIDDETQALKECVLAVQVPAAIPRIFRVERMQEADQYWDVGVDSSPDGVVAEAVPSSPSTALKLILQPVPEPRDTTAVDPPTGGNERRLALNIQSPETASAITSTSPTPFAQPGIVFSVGDGTVAPKIVSMAEAEYSDEARSAKREGTVSLSAIIGEDGIPVDITVLHALGFGLDENAIESVKKWRFGPALRDGQPVKYRVSMEVNFRLL